MERLNRDDAAILRLENAAVLGHTLKLLVVGPGKDGTAATLDEVRGRVGERLARVPRMRERVIFDEHDVAFWEEAPDFDLERHVVAREPTVDGDHGELERIAGELMAERLDHERPLWRMDVIEGLEQGATAIAWRIHHCMADGMTGVRWLGDILLDDENEPDGVPVESKASGKAQPPPKPASAPAPRASPERTGRARA